MKTKTISLAIAVAFATAVSAVAGGAGVSRSANPASTQFTLKPIPASAVHHGWQAPRIRNKNGTSLNWSGYAVYPLAQSSSVIETPKGKGNGKGNKPGGSTTPTFSDVTGSWFVPAVSSSSSANTYSSAWIGIDGYAGNTVEQIGTEQDWSDGSPVYYAWFEMYPKWAYELLNFPMNPGDQIAAEVKFTGKGMFTLTIVNESVENGSGNGTFVTTQRLQSAQRLSAEWVMEAPWSGGVLPLANFGTVDFLDCYATMNGGTAAPIGSSQWGIDPMTMEDSGTVKAEPSGLLSGGTSFGVTWEHE